MQTVFSEDVFDDEDQKAVVITKEVLLNRQEEGFGLRLVGGKEEGTQVTDSFTITLQLIALCMHFVSSRMITLS